MAFLKLHGHEINNFFQLLGTKENDITLSLSWVLSNCPAFLGGFIHYVCDFEELDFDKVEIDCQEYETNKGYTDIEIKDNETFHIIVEAKRGWNLPSKEQINKYAKRKSFAKSKIKRKCIVTLSECSRQYAAKKIPEVTKNGIPLVHCSFREIFQIAQKAYEKSNHAQKRLLDDFCQYMRGWMTMQNYNSNWVYVVSLSRDCPAGSSITYIDVVEKYSKYFHPYDYKGWPKEPPNYIAFRYEGKLQSIHHIESYVVTSNLHDEIKEMPDFEEDGDYFVYRLGPAIVPAKEVKTGNIYRSGRVWAMLDTLLTCDTISEARNVSNQRIEKSEEE